MKLRITFTLFFLLLSSALFAQQLFPGGVPGAEAWYIANYDDLDQDLFPNTNGYPNVKFYACGTDYGQALVNFNHSIGTMALCISYNAPLEISTSRNIFFVGEPKNVPPYSHVSTSWNPALAALPQTDSIIRNRFDISNEKLYVNNLTSSFNSLDNANVNFYHWNIYQIDKKFKSYGYDGETIFNIGKGFDNGTTTGAYFQGNFPEYISFPFELTANQKNRVESYLALKYGITLEQSQSYKNAKNISFWNSSNNPLFGNRIFGIGRDDISGLNQLESESIHFKNYLIASVGKLFATNLLKQEDTSIVNNNFIVFGDNGLPDGLDEVNDFNVRTLNRKWLSQNTGENAKTIPMFFKLNLDTVLQNELITDPHYKIWMLHDKYVTNQEVSDFNSNYVEYYEPASMDGIQYAFYEDVLFDTDEAIYDQYTFGVGPEMIVQARFHTDNCDDEFFEKDIVITGGEAPYDINIQNTNAYNANFTINQNVMTFTAEAPNTYTVYVTDDDGNTANVTFEVIQYDMELDLASPITLTASQQQATIDAGQGISDPEATYQWYLDGELLEIYTSSITVSEPGEYTVVITSGNRACEQTGSVIVQYDLTGTPAQFVDCNPDYASINLSLSGGIPPYTTVVTSTTQTVSQVHNSLNYVFPNIPFGEATVTTTDSNGAVFEQIVTLEYPLPGIEVDLLSQLQQLCNVVFYQTGTQYPIISCENDFTLDASLLVTHPNAEYEWFRNGISLNIFGPLISIDDEGTSTSSTPRTYTVKITNPDNGCSITESFVAKAYYRIHDENSAFEEELISRSEESATNDSYIKTRLYPNPSEANTTFYYEVYSDQQFNGTVQIFTATGALVQQVDITGQSNYKLPFELLTAGVYFVCTETNGKLLIDKIIIK